MGGKKRQSSPQQTFLSRTLHWTPCPPAGRTWAYASSPTGAPHDGTRRHALWDGARFDGTSPFPDRNGYLGRRRGLDSISDDSTLVYRRPRPSTLDAPACSSVKTGVVFQSTTSPHSAAWTYTVSGASVSTNSHPFTDPGACPTTKQRRPLRHWCCRLKKSIVCLVVTVCFQRPLHHVQHDLLSLV